MKKAWLPEACESNVRACERVKNMLRRVTHAQGVCLDRSVSKFKRSTDVHAWLWSDERTNKQTN